MQNVSFTTECLDHELKIAVSIYPSNRFRIFRIMRQEKLSLNPIHSNISYFIITWNKNIGSTLLHIGMDSEHRLSPARIGTPFDAPVPNGNRVEICLKLALLTKSRNSPRGML